MRVQHPFYDKYMPDLIAAETQGRTTFCSSVQRDVWHDQAGPKAYEWWYFDALSDDGREAVFITFADNYVFSPRYAAAQTAEQGGRLRFPAITFLYAIDGEVIFKTVHEFTERQFKAGKASAQCSIGESSFHVDSADYGSGYMVNIDVPLGRRRLKASFEWLSVEADLMPGERSGSCPDSFWNMAATRSDVSGKIELWGRGGKLKRQFHFRGTGYHDHIGGNDPIVDTLSYRHWGRAHFNDATAVFCIKCGLDGQPETKLFLVRDGQMQQRSPQVEGSRFRRDRFGIKFPSRLSFMSDDGVRLRIKPFRIVDSSFYDIRMLSQVTLMLRDGKPRKTIGISEFLAPRNIRYRLFRWFTDLKIRKSDDEQAD